MLEYATHDAAQWLKGEGVILTANQVAGLARNGAFSNARKNDRGHWRIPVTDLLAFVGEEVKHEYTQAPAANSSDTRVKERAIVAPGTASTNSKKRYRLATTIAVIALVISVAQVLLTSPLIIDYFMKPRLEVLGAPPMAFERVINYEFIVMNTGRSPAKQLEISITTLREDTVLILAESEDVFVERESKTTSLGGSLPLEKLFVRTDRLVHEDYFHIVIQRRREVWERYRGNPISRGLPHINSVNHADGRGLVSLNDPRITREIITPQQLDSILNMQR